MNKNRKETDFIVECVNLEKIFKINKRPKGLFGHLANLIVPKFTYKKAVNGVSLIINRGDAVGFIGENGAGKSTTIKMLTGILAPSNGELKVLGLEPRRHRKKYVSKIGAVFGQKSQLSWDLPVIDSFYLLQKIYQIPDFEFEETLSEFIELLEMEEFIERPVRQLSLGQRMRADIAASLLHKPELIFFDEPTIGLDVIAKEKIREFIRYLNQELKVTVIFTTHDMQDIELVCQRLIIIDEGKKIYDGTVDGIKTSFGGEKKIIAQFDKDIAVAPISNVNQIVKPNRVIEFRFSNEKISVKKVIEILISKYDIHDISFSEKGIEEVVREIYEKGI